MSWHVGQGTATRYAHQQLDPVSTASVEAHLLECEACRVLVGAEASSAVGAPSLDALWDGIVDGIDQPSTSWVERLLCRAGLADATARLVAAAPRARLAYALAVGLSLLLAFVAARTSYDDVFSTFLLVAPLGPLAATALAFSRSTDPVFELLGTVPTSPLRLLLIRTTAAVGPAIVLTAVSFVWTVERGWLAAAWLLPSLALSAIALALSTWIAIERAALAVGVGWVAAPLVIRTDVRALLDAFGSVIQIGSVVALAAAVAVLVVRQSVIEYREA
jgi:hypothetical protein